MIGRRALLAGVLAGVAASADAQVRRIGRSPGFVSGFRFLGTAPWTPAALGAALVGWWDASETRTITLNGGNVSAWASKVSGTVATQSTASAQPAYSASARNGLPGLAFSGASQALMFTPSALPTGSAAMTIVAVVTQTATGGAGGPFSYGATANGQRRALGHVNYNDYIASLGYGGGYDLISTTAFGTADHVIVLTITAGASPTVTIRDNGAQVASGTVSTLNAQAVNGMIGAVIDNTIAYWKGVIQEVYVANTALSIADAQKAEAAAAWKWGEQGNLPAGHPYKNARPLL